MALRGGNWNNGAQAGVFTLNLNNLRSNTNTNIGFRPALYDSQKVMILRDIIQCNKQRALNPRLGPSQAAKRRNI